MSYANVTKQSIETDNDIKDIKVVIVGDGDVGKTSLLVSYTTNQFPSEYSPTVYDNYVVTFLVNDTRYNMILIDTAGQEEYRSIVNLAFQEVDVFIVCFALNNPNSLLNVEFNWIPLLQQKSPTTPILLVGTKSDMPLENKIGVSHNDAIKVSKRIGAIRYLECSALTQKGLKQVFDTAITTVIDGWSKKRKTKGSKQCSFI